jgi:poly-gamma-glutamate capsule biosynthesis protein CapA/YwtB (metallophosphatase superfamily)
MELTLALCGDVMPGADVGELMGSASVKEWLRGVSPAWDDADLVIANLECPCVNTASPVSGPRPEIIFRAPARRLEELADAGVTAVTLANNHILNCGPTGLLETIAGLQRAGIRHAGAGMTIEEALQPAFMKVRGVTIALLAFCYGPPAGRRRPGVAPHTPDSMRRGLRMARSADLVVAALHDGLEYSDVPTTAVRERFRFLADHGADIVFGHHPHVLQGVEWRGNVPIAYSLGDLLFHNSLPDVAARNFARIVMGRYAADHVRGDPEKFSRGAILKIRISGSSKQVERIPFRQDARLRPVLSLGNARGEDLQRLADLDGVLMNEEDPRHSLAEMVVAAARREGLEALRLRDVFKLGMRPRWRYVPRGVSWVWSRMKSLSSAYSARERGVSPPMAREQRPRPGSG